MSDALPQPAVHRGLGGDSRESPNRVFLSLLVCDGCSRSVPAGALAWLRCSCGGWFVSVTAEVADLHAVTSAVRRAAERTVDTLEGNARA